LRAGRAGFREGARAREAGADEALRRLALEALPRVVDRENSELAQLWAEGGDPSAFDVFEALHERLLTAGAGPTLGALDGLLKPAPPPPPRAAPSRTRVLQPPDPPPRVRAMIAASPALRATTAAHADAWALTTGGVLNIYDDLSEADEDTLDEQDFVLVQFARRFAVRAPTLEVVNRLLEARPDAALRLVLNGYGAFDDLDFLARLPYLRTVAIDGSEAFLEGVDAQGVAARFPWLERVVFRGQLMERGR
jgi:hypothetical protein